MSNRSEISIFQVVGTNLCVASSDGQKVYDRIVTFLSKDKKVSLSFLNVTLLTSAFLNAAIGQLYGKFNEDQIRTLLEVKDMQNDDIQLLRRVVDTAKHYFKDPKKFMMAVEGDELMDSSDA